MIKTIKAEIYKYYIESSKNVVKVIVSTAFYGIIFIIFYYFLVNFRNNSGMFITDKEYFSFAMYFLSIRLSLSAISSPLSCFFEECKNGKIKNISVYRIKSIMFVRSYINYIITAINMIVLYFVISLILGYIPNFQDIIYIFITFFILYSPLVFLGLILTAIILNFSYKNIIILFSQVLVVVLILYDFNIKLINYIIPTKNAFYMIINKSYTLNDLLVSGINSIFYVGIFYLIYCKLISRALNKIGIKYFTLKS